MNLYCLKCKSLKVYQRPFSAVDDSEAILAVRNTLTRGLDEGLAISIEDFSLFKIGVFDSKDGLKKTTPKLVAELDKLPGLTDVIDRSLVRLAKVKDLVKEVATDGKDNL